MVPFLFFSHHPDKHFEMLQILKPLLTSKVPKKFFGAVRDVMTGTIVTKKNVLKYKIDPVALILPFRNGVDRVYNNCVSCFQE